MKKEKLMTRTREVWRPKELISQRVFLKAYAEATSPTNPSTYPFLLLI